MQEISYKIKELPMEERPREKLIHLGSDHLSNRELLAIILRTGSRNKSVLDLSQELLVHCGGLEALPRMSLQELQEIKGIGKSKACQLMAAVELNKRIAKAGLVKKRRVTSPEAVYTYYADVLKFENKERFVTLLLNTKNEILTHEVISIGNLNRSIVHPREVFQEAIKKSAAAIILLHNHPSGDLTPSTTDKKITTRLMEAGHILGIDVLDHVIVGYHEYFSFKEHQLMR